MLRKKGLEPVFKNWDAALHGKQIGRKRVRKPH
jgi:hypothetical protein